MVPTKRRRGDSPSSTGSRGSTPPHHHHRRTHADYDANRMAARGPAFGRSEHDARPMRPLAAPSWPSPYDYQPRDHRREEEVIDLELNSREVHARQRWATFRPARPTHLEQRSSSTASPLPGLSQWLDTKRTDHRASSDHAVRDDDRFFRQSTLETPDLWIRDSYNYTPRPRASSMSPEPRLSLPSVSTPGSDSMESVGNESPLPIHPLPLRHRSRDPPSTPQLVRTASLDTTDSSSPSYPRARTLTKSSRYLREIDRRNILQRIERGEKQATLAKEYQVSRAAICNLNKHRDAVLSRKDENPLAKHPKKPRTKDTAASARIKITSKAPEMLATQSAACVYEIKSRATGLLLTHLRDPRTKASDFRRYADRLLRLMLEEALALVPVKTNHVSLSETVVIEGIEAEWLTCGIALEVTGGTHFLRVFHAVEPHGPTGSIRLRGSQLDAVLLPPNLQSYNVFLLDLFTYSGTSLAAAIATLTSRGVRESSVWLITLCVAYEVAELIHTRFPHVKIITTQVDRSSTLRVAEIDIAAPTTAPQLTATPDIPTKVLVKRFLEVYAPKRPTRLSGEKHTETAEVTI